MTDLDLPVRRPINREPTHPGELMREILLDHIKLSISEAARRMDIPRPALHSVLNGAAALTPDMAFRFARLVGGEPSLFVQMQTKRDLWLTARRLKDDLDQIEPVGIAARDDDIPTNELFGVPPAVRDRVIAAIASQEFRVAASRARTQPFIRLESPSMLNASETSPAFDQMATTLGNLAKEIDDEHGSEIIELSVDLFMGLRDLADEIDDERVRGIVHLVSGVYTALLKLSEKITTEHARDIVRLVADAVVEDAARRTAGASSEP